MFLMWQPSPCVTLMYVCNGILKKKKIHIP
jgi:hypothetical protein